MKSRTTSALLGWMTREKKVPTNEIQNERGRRVDLGGR